MRRLSLWLYFHVNNCFNTMKIQVTYSALCLKKKLIGIIKKYW